MFPLWVIDSGSSNLWHKGHCGRPKIFFSWGIKAKDRENERWMNGDRELMPNELVSLTFPGLNSVCWMRMVSKLAVLSAGHSETNSFLWPVSRHLRYDVFKTLHSYLLTIRNAFEIPIGKLWWRDPIKQWCITYTVQFKVSVVSRRNVANVEIISQCCALLIL